MKLIYLVPLLLQILLVKRLYSLEINKAINAVDKKFITLFRKQKVRNFEYFFVEKFLKID